MLISKTMNISRKIECRPPNKYDIQDTKTILKDFKIIVNIPKFNTLRELNAWRYKQIKSSLS